MQLREASVARTMMLTGSPPRLLTARKVPDGLTEIVGAAVGAAHPNH